MKDPIQTVLNANGLEICRLIRESAICKVALFKNLPKHEVSFNEASQSNKILNQHVSEMIRCEVDAFLRRSVTEQTEPFFQPIKKKEST
jgi:hypothetical protein